MASFTKICRDCHQEIKMSNQSGQWEPYDLSSDGIDCTCKVRHKHQQGVTTTSNDVVGQTTIDGWAN